MTEYATSADGARIAFDREGAGPPVVLVGGALDPSTVPLADLARHLASHGFEVVALGDDAAGTPSAQRLGALRAVIAELTEGADDTVTVVGAGSGGTLAVEAAAAGLPVSRIVVFGEAATPTPPHVDVHVVDAEDHAEPSALALAITGVLVDGPR